MNLEPKSINIPMRKSVSTTSSSRSTKGRSQASILNSKKHGVVELDPSTAPIALLLSKESLSAPGPTESFADPIVRVASGDNTAVLVFHIGLRNIRCLPSATLCA
ncbi:hypothetical protein V6N13_064622 [Hibiscus sabdariffa]